MAGLCIIGAAWRRRICVTHDDSFTICISALERPHSMEIGFGRLGLRVSVVDKNFGARCLLLGVSAKQAFWEQILRFMNDLSIFNYAIFRFEEMITLKNMALDGWMKWSPRCRNQS
jgi:hypothetical protein